MEYLAQASDGLPSQATMQMQRDIVPQTGRDTQHNFLAQVGVYPIVDAVVFLPKRYFQEVKMIDLQGFLVSEEMA